MVLVFAWAIETRGPEHAELVIHNLREAGYKLRLDF
jgi:hypothetical protein